MYLIIIILFIVGPINAQETADSEEVQTVSTPRSCDQAIEFVLGRPAGPSGRNKCDDADENSFKQPFVDCLYAKPEQLPGGPTYISRCFDAAKDGFSQNLIDCMTQIKDIGFEEIGPTLHGMIFDAAKSNSCDKLSNCFSEISNSGRSLTSPTNIANCRSSIVRPTSRNSVDLRPRTQVTKPIKLCTYNLETGELMEGPNLDQLPADQRLEAYQKYVESIKAIRVIARPCN